MITDARLDPMLNARPRPDERMTYRLGSQDPDWIFDDKKRLVPRKVRALLLEPIKRATQFTRGESTL